MAFPALTRSSLVQVEEAAQASGQTSLNLPNRIESKPLAETVGFSDFCLRVRGSFQEPAPLYPIGELVPLTVRALIPCNPNWDTVEISLQFRDRRQSTQAGRSFYFKETSASTEVRMEASGQAFVRENTPVTLRVDRFVEGHLLNPALIATIKPFILPQMGNPELRVNVGSINNGTVGAVFSYTIQQAGLHGGRTIRYSEC